MILLLEIAFEIKLDFGSPEKRLIKNKFFFEIFLTLLNKLAKISQGWQKEIKSLLENILKIIQGTNANAYIISSVFLH